MEVCVSMRAGRKVYHRRGCIYEARIRIKNRFYGSEKKAKADGYHFCKYCQGLKGVWKAYAASPTQKGAAVQITYDNNTDAIYLRTDVGFWKVCMNRGRKLILWHLNEYDKTSSFETLIHSAFHRQKDVEGKESLEQIVAYIYKHDRAKSIIEDDYRKLPKRSKKEKYYYRVAEKRHLRENQKRVQDLFAILENGEKPPRVSFM